MIDCRNSRSVKDRVFELDIRRVYIYTHTFVAWRPRRSTCHEASIRFNRKYPFPSVGKSFAWFSHDRANLHRMTKGRFGGAKGLPSRNKIALRHRGTRVFDHHPRLFTKFSLNSQSERDFIARRSSLNGRASNWAPSLRLQKKNQSLSWRRYTHRWDFFFISFLEAHSRTIFRAFDYYFSR